MMSEFGIGVDFETESVYKITVRDIGNVSFKVRIVLGEKSINNEPTEVVTIEICDLLTKSIYHADFGIDEVGKMGSYFELEQLFIILQSCLSGLQKGVDSTTHKMEFGYIATPEKIDTEGKEEVLYDRKSMSRAKMALKKSYSKLNKNPSSGDSLVATVKYFSDVMAECFAFELPITNKDDETGRLMDMMKDRKNEIEYLRAELQKSSGQAEIKELKNENEKLKQTISDLCDRMNGFEEGKEDKSVVKAAHFYASGKTATANHMAWDGVTFDRLGAEYIRRDNGNKRIQILKSGVYRIAVSAYIVNASAGAHMSLHRSGSEVRRSYAGSDTGYNYITVNINQLMELKQGQYIEIYVVHNNSCNGGTLYNLLQIEFLQQL